MECRSCKFFEQALGFWDGLPDESELSGQKEEFGFCRRHAPTPFRSLEVKEVQWPVVNEADWCGEYVDNSEEATDGSDP